MHEMYQLWAVFLLLLLLSVACSTPLGLQSMFKPQHEVSLEAVQATLSGAEQGNKDSLYFLGLLKLYGIKVARDEPQAAQYIERAAEAGHTEAASAWGMLLYSRRADEAALRWFQVAAEAGHEDSMWLLGRCYYEGRGDGTGQPNFEQARAWFYRAAQKGSMIAQHYMGVLHEYGLGVAQDYKTAKEWFGIASLAGNADSLYHLGLMKAYGRGYNQDFTAALIDFQKAAKLNHAASMYYLGIMCLYGHGLPVDYDLALLWLKRAAVTDTDDLSIHYKAKNAAEELKERMKESKNSINAARSGYDYGIVNDL